MAVSDAAVREIAKVLLTHVDQESLRKVVDDLLDIRGDKSFRDMIATLARELKAGF
jgi:signal transduction protein with GAF and PtsI domain